MNPKLLDSLNDAFMDIVDKIGRVLTAEFDKRFDAPAAYFNSGYSYTDFMGRILSNEFGEISMEDEALADKLIGREMKKLGSAEIFTLRLFAVEMSEGECSFRESLKMARFHILHHWKLTLLSTYLYNDILHDFEPDPFEVMYKPTDCPHCGGKVVDIVYGELNEEIMDKADRGEVLIGGPHKFPDDGDWGCLRCGGQFKLKQ